MVSQMVLTNRYGPHGRAFLAELERREPELVPTLHGRAAAWYEGQRLPELAVDHGQRSELCLVHPMGRHLQAVVDVDGEQSRPASVLDSHVSLPRGEPASYAAWRSSGRLGGASAVSGARRTGAKGRAGWPGSRR